MIIRHRSRDFWSQSVYDANKKSSFNNSSRTKTFGIFLFSMALLGAVTINFPHSGGLRRASRHLSSEVSNDEHDEQMRMRYGISREVAASVNGLAAQLLADESSLYTFDEKDPRPVVNTFFRIIGKSLSLDSAEMLGVWKQAWSAAGYNPRVLNLSHAESHPDSYSIIKKLDEIPLGNNVPFDSTCYLRHFAMASVGGGIMTDYDTLPLNMNKYSLLAGGDGGLPNNGMFTSFEGHTPSFVVGSAVEWDRVAKALIREGIEAGKDETTGIIVGDGIRLFSDMYALESLIRKHEVLTFEEPRLVGELRFKIDQMRDGETFTEAFTSDACDKTKNLMALHFSHYAVEQEYDLQAHGIRALIMAESMERLSEICNGIPNFGFKTSTSPAVAENV